jgi:hypothetical protein
VKRQTLSQLAYYTALTCDAYRWATLLTTDVYNRDLPPVGFSYWTFLDSIMSTVTGEPVHTPEEPPTGLFPAEVLEAYLAELDAEDAADSYSNYSNDRESQPFQPRYEV